MGRPRIAAWTASILALSGCGEDGKSPPADMMEQASPGTLLWVRTAGGADADQGDAVAAAPDGVLIAGVFGGKATFGQGQAAEETLSASDIEEAFLARYDAAGELLWSRADGGPGADRAESVVADGQGNAFVTGSFSAAAVFGAGRPEETTLNAVGSRDMFLARYDADGELTWAKSAGSFYGHDGGQGIAIGSDGALLLCGQFTHDALFDQGGPGSMTLPGFDLSDIFVARYTPDGALSWATPAGGTGQDSARALAAAPGGGAFVVGSFEGTATFGEAPNQQALVSAGLTDVFFARYGPDGVLLWAKRAGGGGNDEATWVGVSSDQVLLAGSFSQTAEFGDGGDPLTLDSSGSLDAFLVSYDLDGAVLWAATAGGPDDDVAQGAALADDGGAIVTGSYGNSAVFGEGESAEAVLQSTGGGSDLFVGAWDRDGALRWVRPAAGTGVDSGLGAAVLEGGTIVTTGRFGGQATFGVGEEGEITLPSSGASDVFLAGFVP